MGTRWSNTPQGKAAHAEMNAEIIRRKWCDLNNLTLKPLLAIGETERKQFSAQLVQKYPSANNNQHQWLVIIKRLTQHLKGSPSQSPETLGSLSKTRSAAISDAHVKRKHFETLSPEQQQEQGLDLTQSQQAGLAR